MIEVPQKIWRPRVISKYTTPEFDDDNTDDILDYGQYGKCVYKRKVEWFDNLNRQDIIIYDDAKHASELEKDLKFDDSVPLEIRSKVTEIIKEYWDCFIKEGAKRPILSYEFGIDTGGAKPVYCRKPTYGPYESKIIMEQTAQLLENGWIERCGGPWGKHDCASTKATSVRSG